MNVTVNMGNFTDIERFVSHYLYIYGYLIIGPMLVLVNIPVFLLVVIRKALRLPYLILAVVFLNNGLTGMSAVLVGAKRVTISADEEQCIAHHDCVLNVSIFLLSMSFLNGLSLLMNSVERLCVVVFPIYYYFHSKRLVCSLIATQYVITIIVMTFTVVASLIEPVRYISNICMLHKVYTSYFYVTLTLMSSTASLISIILMVIVVIILNKRFGAHFLSSHSYNRNLTNFLKNQKRYTQTSLISCCFTFFLVVVPSIVKCIYVLDRTKRSQIAVMCSIYLPLLNSFNMVVLFMYRQRDIRNAAIQNFKWLFCRKERHIHPAMTVGNSRFCSFVEDKLQIQLLVVIHNQENCTGPLDYVSRQVAI